jgi:Fe2+ or Zn2+ uptake regulation protein
LLVCERMNSAVSSNNDRCLNDRLAVSGLRFTRQRRQVFEVLLGQQDHPTADDVFMRVRKSMPDISMATVYNCLDALVKCGLVRQVSLARGAARYCSNLQAHGHFYCVACGNVFDVALSGAAADLDWRLPEGYRVNHYELAAHGICPACADRPRTANMTEP